MKDPELPDGFQDDDFDQRELEAAGRRSAALRRKGICDHGWWHEQATSVTCLHCGKVARTLAELRVIGWAGGNKQ